MGAQVNAITVVVITRNRWPDLCASLPRHEAPVVVVDNGSTDGTPERVRGDFPHVRVVALGDNRGATARNLGAAAVSTPLVAFADDDSWWAPGALGCAAEVFRAHPRLGLLAGRVLVGPDAREDPICAAMASAPLGVDPDLPGPSVLGFLACGAVVRREAYLAAGGFDDVVFFGGEEERLALDLATLGWGLAYVDDVVAHHHPSPARDRATREALIARNRLLTHVLRRPWTLVAAEFGTTLTQGSAGRRAVRNALPHLPKALRHRRVLPAHVEAARAALGSPRSIPTVPAHE